MQFCSTNQEIIYLANSYFLNENPFCPIFSYLKNLVSNKKRGWDVLKLNL